MRSFRSASRNREVYSLDILAGRRPAVSRTVKMSDKEGVARRAPGAIVRNDGQQASAKAACGLCRAATVEAARLSAPQTAPIFRDRSVRRAARSRSFSPCGLLWLFLRKKEQENSAATF